MVVRAVVLYQDRSGIFGHWYLDEFNKWKFKREIEVDTSEQDMLYLLSELKKIKEIKQ